MGTAKYVVACCRTIESGIVDVEQFGRPPISSSCQGLIENWMKRALCLEKGTGVFLFRVVLKLKFMRFSVYWQASRSPRTNFMLGFASRTKQAR